MMNSSDKNNAPNEGPAEAKMLQAFDTSCT